MKIGELEHCLNLERKIVVGLSGGADSVCLAHFLWKMQKYEIVLAHFNHCLRGKESDADENFCVNFAEKLGLEIEIEKWEKPEKSEAKAREARYRFLRKIQQKYKAQAICLAHHADDQVETILLNFVRGTGLRGLSGMPFFENEILRPFLNISKKEILDYAKQNKLKYRTDKSNFETVYNRNLLRLKILPELEKINSNFRQTLLLNLKNYRQIADFLETKAKVFSVQKTIKIKEFSALPNALQTEILRQKMDGLTEPSAKKIEEILRIIHGGKGNKFKQFGKLRVEVRGGNIIFGKL